MQFLIGTEFLNGKGEQSIRTENINAAVMHPSIVCIDIRYYKSLEGNAGSFT